MKLDPILTKAVRLAGKKNYNDAIQTLETEVNRYHGSYTYYYLLGVSYLYSQIYSVALTYLRLAAEQKKRDPNTMLGLAAVYLTHGDTDRAISLYLDVQNLDPSNRIVKRALKIVRKHPGPENISAWIDSGRLNNLFPPFPKADISGKGIAVRILAGLAGLCIVFGVALKTGFFSLSPNRGQRLIPAEIGLVQEEKDAPVQTGGSYRYVLTRDQVLSEYNEAQKLFITYRDDAAKVKLNRILESNASESVKNKARILVNYTDTPGFNTLKDRFTYSEIERDPFIYRDCHVIWRGMASNLNVEQNHTAFDFLVGYDTYRTVEGIIQVDFDFAIPVNPERPIEILARVIPLSTEREPRIRLQGIALNQAGLLEQPQSK